jgi:arylsulfatase A-like enzyme
MNRRTFLRNTFSSAAVLAFSAQAKAAERLFGKLNRKRKPNIVFILTDDQGWGDLGCYGHPDLKTPRIDQLAAEGVKFNQFYTNGSVCSPTRAGIMTGQFPSRVGVHHALFSTSENIERDVVQYLDTKTPNITRIMQNNGYITGHFGKWHLGVQSGAAGIPAPSEYGIDDYKCSYGPAGWEVWDGWSRETHRPISNQLIMDEAVRFIDENKDRPFFLQLWTFDPHTPLLPTPEMREPYSGYPEPQQTYYSVMSDLDYHVGRVVDHIEQSGLAEDTLFIYASDNGPEIHGSTNCGDNGPFRGMKRSLYEGGIRTPMITRWKGVIKPGQIDDKTVIAGSDFLPSLCSISGIDVPENAHFDGEDLSAAILGRAVTRNKPVIWEYRSEITGQSGDPTSPMYRICSPMYAVREGEWKLLWNPDDSRTELYNIVTDPVEENNVASVNPTTVNRLKGYIQQFIAELPDDRWKHEHAGLESW